MIIQNEHLINELVKKLKYKTGETAEDSLSIEDRIEIADSLKNIGELKLAIVEYSAVAGILTKNGKVVQALAVLKKILEIDPNHQETQSLFARLYLKVPENEPVSNVIQIPIHYYFKVTKDIPIPKVAKIPDIKTREDYDQPLVFDDRPTAARVFDPKKEAMNANTSEITKINKFITVNRHEIPYIPLLSELTKDEFMNVLGNIRLFHFKKGEVIIREGEFGDSFYIISKGEVLVYKTIDDKMIELSKMRSASFFGEFEFFSKSPRRCSVAATLDSEVFEISSEALKQIVESHPNLYEVIIKFFQKRLINNLLHTSPIFNILNQKDRQRFQEKFKSQFFKKGSVIIKEGMTCNALFIILSGAVNVLMNDGQVDLIVKTLKEGEFFGILSLMTNQPSLTKIVTKVDSYILKLPDEEFKEMLLKYPQVMDQINAIYKSRLFIAETVLSGQTGYSDDGLYSE